MNLAGTRRDVVLAVALAGACSASPPQLPPATSAGTVGTDGSGGVATSNSGPASGSSAVADSTSEGDLTTADSSSSGDTQPEPCNDGAGICHVPGASSNLGDAPVRDVDIGDFDSDDAADLVIVQVDNSWVSVASGDGLGGFGPPTPALNQPLSAVRRADVADFNGDDQPDLVLALGGPAGGAFVTMSGSGNATFNEVDRVEDDFGLPVGVAFARLGGTSPPDFVGVTSEFLGTFLANGPGVFQPSYEAITGLTHTGLAVADVDDDGLDDAVVASEGDDSIVVWGSAGGGLLQPGFTLDAKSPVAVAVGDVNADGIVDLVAAEGSSGVVLVARGLRDSEFADPIVVPGLAVQSDAAVADFDQDGFDDIVVIEPTSGDLAFLRGSEAMDLDPVVFPGVAAGADRLTVGDINGDGIADVVAWPTMGGDVMTLVSTSVG